MLVLNRKVDEAIYISVQIEVKILSSKDAYVSVGRGIPGDASIVRSELEDWKAPASDNRVGSESELVLLCSSDKEVDSFAFTI